MDGNKINNQAKEKRKKNAVAVISDRHKQGSFGIRTDTDGAFGIRKSTDFGSHFGEDGISPNSHDAGKAIKNAKENMKEGIKDTIKDVRESAKENIRTAGDFAKSGGNAASVKIKKTIRAAAPPKVHIKNVIKKARIMQMIQSGGDAGKLAENMGKAGINAIMGAMQYMARCVIKGMLFMVKKLLTLLGPVIGGFFLFAMLLVICIQSSNTAPLSFNVPETGKVDGVRVDMKGIDTNPWYTTKNPFHNSGYGMVPRKSSGKGNCTCYAWGRRAEMTGEAPQFSTGNASAWYDYNKKNKIYKYGSVPKPGAVCCWKGGSDGSGHVAVVEIVNADGSFTISESSWTRFFFRTREGMTTGNMDEGNLKFQGFIYIDEF